MDKKTKRVKIYVKPKAGILDPQGKAVENALHSLNYKNVRDLKIGKYIEMEIDVGAGLAPAQLEDQVKEMCAKLLANPVIEDYSFEVEA